MSLSQSGPLGVSTGSILILILFPCSLSCGFNTNILRVLDPGENEFFQKDADVAKCILDLHSNQKDVCISVKGSSCDNGYIAGGGQLQNMFVSVPYPLCDVVMWY